MERKMLISASQSELKRMQFAAEVDRNIRVSITSRKRIEDSQRWSAVGRIEAGQLITDLALFFRFPHSVASRLWKQFETTQTVFRRPVAVRPRITNPEEDRYIAIVAKRNRRATSTRVTSMVTSSIGKAISSAKVRQRLHMNGL
ncbi:HTH_Tnp_Tc3_2 domain-containing protein [Trichonephila clavipes]|uniref:HTH_Tnp_Tc3_2 domain-containing protein n=1 Tax=Trichonephila clavipes TaxID=2585209 RepID=A0A8X6VGF2_TRICX|nr:HTH_Tnp_Tc3_2 domain-containing protein [Trichonephila clavipes]